MKVGSRNTINWKTVWRLVLIGYVLIVLTAGLWGWWLEGILIG